MCTHAKMFRDGDRKGWGGGAGVGGGWSDGETIREFKSVTIVTN